MGDILNKSTGGQIADAIDRRIRMVAQEVYDNAPYNKTKFGRVVARQNGLFEVMIERKSYTNVVALRNVGDINVGETVIVDIPNNNMSNATILGVADGTLLSGAGTGTVKSVNVIGAKGLVASGGPITESGTITVEHTNTVAPQTTQALYPIAIDGQGHISGYGDALNISDIMTLSGEQTVLGSKRFIGSTDNKQTGAGVYLGLDESTGAENANISIVSEHTAAYIDMGRPNIDFDFRIIKWNDGSKTSAQFLYGGNASGTITIPQKDGTMALTTDLASYLPLAGGTLTGVLKLNEVDGSCINFDNAIYINKVGGQTAFGSDATATYVGRTAVPMLIRGSGIRPTYNGNNMALFSDISGITGLAIKESSFGAQYGYIWFTNGLLFNWGLYYNSGSEGQTYTQTFAKSYSRLDSVVVTFIKTDTTTREWNIYSYNNYNFTLRKNATSDTASGYSYFASGYRDIT